jgi:ribosomal protein S18 acetylase RimI-like enzyme
LIAAAMASFTGSNVWREMTATDLPAVQAIADALHPNHPEDEAIFINRLKLHAAGCCVLVDGETAYGYAVSHPWHFKEPPALNALLDHIPSPMSTYYIHDLAILPQARKSAAAEHIVSRLARHATDLKLPNMSLVAVNNSVHFWERQGFLILATSELDRKLRSYGDHAQFMVRDLT